MQHTGYVQCGACDVRFPFSDLNGHAEALIAAEYDHDDTEGSRCEALGTNGEHLIVVEGHSPVLARVRNMNPKEER